MAAVFIIQRYPVTWKPVHGAFTIDRVSFQRTHTGKGRGIGSRRYELAMACRPSAERTADRSHAGIMLLTA